ncbi:MAG TPA: B12-binding domain-containing radical SAM protein [Candidatus Komeilibacteria bacterium]|nr:B12-binding domain-containing radical SAM protein [Candidatus Komeilibacteria bacterium]
MAKKILLVYPEYPETFWGFKYAIKFISKKSVYPPLGLLTVAALLPSSWEKKLVDLNVRTLRDKELKWADYVFISAMDVQKKSVKEIIGQCQKLGTKIVAGGPLFTSNPDQFPDIDYLVLNEAEITLAPFLKDLQNGTAKHLYFSDTWANIEKTPLPLWQLINFKNYTAMNIQYSRGCPFNCDFCDITILYGRQVRTKNKQQILTELNSLYFLGWRGVVFIVDDNFIGNTVKLKTQILPALINWTKKNKQPFTFHTESSINLADDPELISLMVQTGFNTVFIGIETVHEESLAECGKFQNQNRNLIESIKKIQRLGLQVQGGFIVGFDHDPQSIFDAQIKFIQKSGIITAMVGLLNAVRGTRLYQRLEQEKRLIKSFSGNNTDFSLNFIPKMNSKTLLAGYKKIIKTIYAPKYYYRRVKTFLGEYRPLTKNRGQFKLCYLMALLKSVLRLGILGKERWYYWGLFFWTLSTRPKLFPLAITFSIHGFHYRKIFEKYL